VSYNFRGGARKQTPLSPSGPSEEMTAKVRIGRRVQGQVTVRREYPLAGRRTNSAENSAEVI